MASTLTLLNTSQLPSSPPADFKRSTLTRRASLIQSPHTQPSSDTLPRRAYNRYSWSSASNTSPVSAAPSPTASETGSAPARKFKLPVRVSTETSFAPSTSSPESRRRSVSVASESKRRSKSLYLQQLEEDKIVDAKASPKLPPKPTSPAPESPPPPAYAKSPVASDSKKRPSSPKTDTKKPSSPKVSSPKAQDPPPPAYDAAKSQPVKEKQPSPRVPQQTFAAEPPTMSSPADQKTAMTGNPAMQNRGIDFAMGNGNTKLTAQSGNGLPLPGLSGRANGPVGNLLRGPVDDEGNLKAAALTVGIKLDLEAEVHLSARVRGDILVGLY